MRVPCSLSRHYAYACPCSPNVTHLRWQCTRTALVLVLAFVLVLVLVLVLRVRCSAVLRTFGTQPCRRRQSTLPWGLPDGAASASTPGDGLGDRRRLRAFSWSRRRRNLQVDRACLPPPGCHRSRRCLRQHRVLQPVLRRRRLAQHRRLPWQLRDLHRRCPSQLPNLHAQRLTQSHRSCPQPIFPAQSHSQRLQRHGRCP